MSAGSRDETGKEGGSSWWPTDLSICTRDFHYLLSSYWWRQTPIGWPPYLSLVHSVSHSRTRGVRWYIKVMPSCMESQLTCVFKANIFKKSDNGEQVFPVKRNWSFHFSHKDQMQNRAVSEYARLHPAQEMHHSTRKDGCKLISYSGKAGWDTTGRDLISILPRCNKACGTLFTVVYRPRLDAASQIYWKPHHYETSCMLCTREWHSFLITVFAFQIISPSLHVCGRCVSLLLLT